MSRWFENYVTGGGCSKRVASDSARKRFSAVIAVMMAIAITCSVAVPGAYANPLEDLGNVISNGVNGITQQLFGVSLLDAGEPDVEDIELYAAGDKGIKKSDPSTIDAWNNILQKEGQASTQNIGRIWTDKSVFTEDAKFTQGPLAGQPITVDGDHDFLVGLSALSSTSNLTSTTYTSQPLDIVLVLDDSGSMAYSIDSDTPNQIVYTAVSADQVVESHGHTETGWYGNTDYIQETRGGEYYVQNDRGGYDRITEVTETHSGEWHEGSYEEHIRWTVNGQTVDPETTQFYTRTEYDLSERRGALQYAVSNFIDQTAAMNAQIADENSKIRLSIVVFEDNASIKNHLTVCEGANVAELKGTLNDLSANGATNAGEGMTSANNELRQNSNRDNTKQIVIFFTDGVPTTMSSFSPGVANTAVVQAGEIKDRGGSVYSIGIFDGADPSQTELGWRPSDTDRANVFMNAVSSNYPNSTAWDNLGQRATGNPDFYKSADNAGSLNEVFQDIFDESTEGATSGSPIEGTDVEGVQDAVPGTLTFTDTLGDYMEITGNTMTLVYGGQKYSATKGEDGVYRFPEQTVDGNDIYKSAKLSDITISIQKGEGSAGDTVTVSMPASFIPLRNYTVTTVDGKTEMSVTDAYPIRLFYGVSVKQGALDSLGDPSNTTLQDYIDKNKTGGGSVNFYANKWNGEQFGDTTATFTPNEGNKFYYYTDNTELYIDENCNTRATSQNISDHETLYYKDTYWVQNGASGSEETKVVAISVSGQDAQGLKYDRDNNAYIAAGTQRYDRPAGLASDKGENTTSTATNVLNPTWNNGTTVSQRLGNNGVIPVELPAQLSVTKNVKFGGDYGTVGFDETDYTNRSYEMTIHVDGASGAYKAQVTNAQGDVVSDEYFDITFNDEGNATHSLKDGEKLTIYGLDGGAEYTVTEESLGNGFATEYTNGSGTLAADGTSSVIVTNAYTLNPVTGKGSELFKGTKVLDGRDWAVGDTFTFQITGQDGAPTPTPNTVTVNAADTEVEGHDAATFNFGDVTYNMPGVYKYTIVETKPATAHPGMSYSSATYEVEVTVADKGDGTMTVTPKMTQTQADNAGDAPAGALEDVNAVFTNHFSETDTSAVLGAYKNYSNNSGNADMDLANDMFTIELRPTGDNADEAPMPEGTQTDEGGRFATTTNANINFDFGRITYDNMMDGKTFTYQIREVPGTVINMDYDAAVYTVQVTVNVNDQNQVSVDTKYFDANDEPLGVGEDGQAIEPTFVNEYDPTDATLADEAAIHGDKTLTGRDMQPNETFGFTLAPKNQAAIAGVNSGTISIADNDWTASVSEGENGVAKGFAFDDMTFTRAGEYTFTVTETSRNGEALPASDSVPGMTYDRDACTVTVTVTDENGVLTPSVSYNNGADQPTDRAVFENTYTSIIDFGNTEGGINVTKKLTGHNMTAGEFAFSVTAVETEGSVDVETADAKLAGADRSFTNQTGAMAGVASQPWKQLAGMTFNQDDAGKTFVYEVRETTTATDVLAVDTAVYTVSLTPHDNADGSMYVIGMVTKGDAEYALIDTRTEEYTAPTLAFENVYTPKPISTSDETETTLQVTKQVMGAPAVEAFDFELTLDAANSDNGTDGVFEDADAKQAFDGMTATTKADLVKDETETLSFGQLTFTKAGTYTFKVKETTTSDLDYWKYDNTERTITVEVYDNGGQLEILYAQGNNPTIENKYDHGTVIIGGDTSTPVEVKKVVTGWTTEADFNFTLAPADYDAEDPESVEHWSAVKPDESAAKAGITDGFTTTDDLGVGNAKTAKFGEITFTEPGTYTFNVTEDGAADFNKQSAGERAGWTYDENTYKIVVEVTETNADGEYDGELHASITSDPVTFTNTYKAGTATVEGSAATFAGTKTIDGRGWLDGETFAFEMTEGVVSEGASWDNVTYLPVNAAEDDEPVAFESATATANEKNDKNGAFWFAGKYLFSEPGTYTFNVTEKQHNNADLPEKNAEPVNGMTYDRHVGTITVKVTDDGSGTLQTEVTPGTGDASVKFVNTFEGEPYTFGLEADEMLGGHKTVEDNVGSFQMADDQFTFVMRAQAVGNPMPNGLETEADVNGYESVFVTNTNTDAHAYTADYSFGSITFDHDDLAGVTDDNNDGKISKAFQYNVYENETDMPAGVSAVNPGRTYTVTITVTENLSTGEITAEGEAVLVNSGDIENVPATLGSLDFVNKYDAGTITGGIQIFKTLSGRNWQQGDTFTFDVSMKADGIAKDDLPEFNFNNLAGNVADYTETNGELRYNITINPSQSETGNSYAFGTGVPTYTHEGTYVYTITERDSTVAGVTKDSSSYVVTVVVEDVLEGNKHVLNRTATITRDGETYENTGRVDFTNTYTSTGELGGNGKVSIAANKTLTGRNMEEEEFTFKVTDKAGQTVSTGTNAPAEDGDAAAITFNAIQYEIKDLEQKSKDSEKTGVVKSVDDKTGLATYTISYKVEEDQTGLSDAGVTPDGATSFNITVVVADDGDGRLSVKVNYPTGTSLLDFKNIYEEKEDSDTEIAVEGTKSIESTMAGVDAPELKDNMFSFTLTGEQVDKDGKPVEGGKPAPMPEGTDTDGSKTVSNDAEGNVDFGTIDFTIESVWGRQVTTFAVGGVERDAYFKYTVTEEKSEVAGVTEDSVAKTFIVHVHDDGKGKVTVETDPAVTADTPLFSFVNEYTPEGTEIGGDGQAQILVTKKVVGAPALSEFDFVLTLTSGNKDDIKVKNDEGEDVSFPDGGVTVSTKGLENNAGSETVSFGSMTFTKAGTYTFEVKETTTSDKDYWTYDNEPKTITVTVTDTDGDGKLEIAQGAIKDNNPTIQNTYTPTSVTVGGDDALKVTKKVTGGNALSEFDFKLAFDANNSTGALADIDGITADGIVKSTAGLEGTQGEQAVSFGDLTFKKVGVYKFTVVETTTKPEGAYGWTYDNAPKTITVTVTDDGFDGQLDATTVVDGVDTNNPTVENVYSPDASDPNDAVISVIKKVSGAPALTEFEFELKLTSDNAANVLVGSGESATAFPAGGIKTSTKGLAGKEGSETATFDGLTFTAAGEYTFTVTELTTTTAGGWTYDNTAKTITVTVEDQDGKLVVTNIDPETTTIENTYTPTGVTVGDDEADLQVTKKVTGGNAPSEFEFVLAFDADAEGNTGKLEDIEGLGEDGTVTVSTSGLEGTQGEETVNFGDLTFNAVGDYYFTVTETTTNDDPNWAYDNAPKTIVVHVTDEDHDGKLEATVEFNNPTVENVYDEPYIPPTPVDPDPSDPSKPDTDVDKKLTGRDLVDGEFSFTITVSSDSASHVSPKSLTGTNDASGNVTFGGKGFVFDEAGDYTFIVAEVLPSDDDPDTEGVQHNGVTYDPATFTITAHVTEQNGKLVVTWENADVPMVFENEYEPEETVDITFGATKVLEGRDLAAGEFSFELRDQDGNVVATATNAADGSIVFTSPVTFTEPGEYTYTIVEVSGNVSGVTYDDAVHTAVVTVTDKGDGTLSATVTYDGSGKLPVFTNVFTPSEPEKPSKPGIPQTGDFAVAVIGGTGLAAVALIATGLYLRRRNSH